MTKFNVTFERYFPHDDGEDICEADESGFETDEPVSLRDAIEYCGGRYGNWEANEYPVRCPHWFTKYESNKGTHDYYTTGTRENHSFHVPEYVTPASRRRIARLLGIKV